MLLAPPPRLSWLLGAPQDLSFTWATPEPAPVFTPPAPPVLAEPGLIAPLPPAGGEALPPEAPLPVPAALVEPPALAVPPALPEPVLLTALPPALTTTSLPPEALEPPILAPGPNPLAADPVAWLEALWAARPALPDIPPPPPPPPLAWFM